MNNKSYSVNIVGASGYVGAELIRLVHAHPSLVIKDLFANSKVGMTVGELFPNFEFLLGSIVFKSADDVAIDDCDVLFLALPHTQSHEAVSRITNSNVVVVDMSADFRFDDIDTYEHWYKTKHLNATMQKEFRYGLPELHREELRTTRFIASPGCYPTAAILATKPFLDEGLFSGNSVIVDAASGTSGAGASLCQTTIFTNVEANYHAYGLIDHRHTPEMSKELGVEVLFTPHLLPMVRGIVATCYIPCDTNLSPIDLRDIYFKKYEDEPFVFVSDQPPATKNVAGTNNAVVSAYYDERTHHIVAISAIDNMVKGSAGQGIQAMNIALGIDETTGLNYTAVYP